MKVGDVVSLVDRRGQILGMVLAILEDEQAQVLLDVPRQPKSRDVCDKCDFSGTHSFDATTSEVICLRTACHHRYGFDTVEEVHPFSNLTNITELEERTARTQLKKEIAALLECGQKEGVVTPEQAESILALL